MRTLLFVTILLAITPLAFAQSGTIDGTFGTNGRIILSPAPEGSLNTAYQVVIQNDGKILTVGSAFTNTQIFAITRHHSNGMLDNSFSDDGVAYLYTADNSDSHSEAYGLAITPDGKIVAVGETADYSRRIPEYYSIVIRLNSDGSLDETFNGTGIVSLKLSDPNVSERLWGVVLQPDGKIIANGSSRKNTFSTHQTMTVVRLNQDGALDPTFGVTGIVRINPAYPSTGTRVELQPDNKIMAVGSVFIDDQYDFAVVRLNTNGTPDNTFDGDGIVYIDFGGNNYGEDVKISSGKIIAGGYGNAIEVSNLDINVVRLLGNGNLDITFDGDGKKTIDHSSEDIARSLAVQNNGSLIICGQSLEYSPIQESNTNHIKVTKLHLDGSLDLGFAGDGSYEDNFGLAAFGVGCTLQTDDKIVVAGWANDGEISGRALTRINNRPVTECTNPSLTATFNEIQVLPAGVSPNTLYIGYFPASVTSIKITVNGDPNGGPYDYSWSISNTNAAFIVSPFDHSRIGVLALREGTATFTVIVRDSRGCEATFTKTITIKDVRCGNKLDKVLVCHVNKHNPDKSKTICISRNAVANMLNNGNYLGSCEDDNQRTRKQIGYEEITEENELEVKVMNNPTDNYFTLLINSNNKKDRVSVRVINQLGSIVEVKENVTAGSMLRVGTNYPTGFYIAQVIQNGIVRSVKLVKK